MTFSSKILSQTITQLCLVKEIDHVVISPGSRNAPLIIGFTQEPEFTNFSIVDERCAGFFALGMAQQLGKPVALVCTSGSALLNYYPAVAEAFYSDIPLVVISADRPSHLIDVGDGQTIRQENVYANHIAYSANCREGQSHQKFNESEINKALNMAIMSQAPVHINVPFSEPLYDRVPTLENRPEIIPITEPEFDSLDDLSSFRDIWDVSKKRMILVGVLKPNSLEEAVVNLLAKDESLIVLTETTSNLHHDQFFPAIDQLIAPLEDEGFEKLRPEVLLTFGGMVVSKKVKAFLRKYPPKKHWHIDEKKAYNTFFCLERHFKTNPNTFLCAFITDTQPIKSDYRNHWLEIKKNRREKHALYLDEVPFSDFEVFSKLFKHLKGDKQLQLSNSATVRYAQLFDVDKNLKVFCNRGTSGIDGSTSTAIGAAYISKLPTIFVTGDLSFLYDSNALWNQYIPSNFKIIVINNSGGGIFRILPGAKEQTHFNSYFETQHHHTAKHLCEMYAISYVTVSKEDELESKLEEFLKDAQRPMLLEIHTPNHVNDTILRGYFDSLR